jgi:hypothetical protein
MTSAAEAERNRQAQQLNYLQTQSVPLSQQIACGAIGGLDLLGAPRGLSTAGAFGSGGQT